MRLSSFYPPCCQLSLRWIVSPFLPSGLKRIPKDGDGHFFKILSKHAQKPPQYFAQPLSLSKQKMLSWLEAKPRALLGRLGPILRQASEPRKQAGAQPDSWGPTCLQVPPCPGKVTTLDAVQNLAPTDLSCALPHLRPCTLLSPHRTPALPDSASQLGFIC